jgi:hypothetical protein
VTWEQRALNGEPKLNASQHVPEFSFAQAKNFMTSVLSDPNAPSMSKGSVKDALKSIVPHKS